MRAYSNSVALDKESQASEYFFIANERIPWSKWVWAESVKVSVDASAVLSTTSVTTSTGVSIISETLEVDAILRRKLSQNKQGQEKSKLSLRPFLFLKRLLISKMNHHPIQTVINLEDNLIISSNSSFYNFNNK